MCRYETTHLPHVRPTIRSPLCPFHSLCSDRAHACCSMYCRWFMNETLAWENRVRVQNCRIDMYSRPRTVSRYLGPFIRVVDLPSPQSPGSAYQAHRLSPLGSRAFPVTGTQTWNDLPEDVTSAESLATFRRLLKTHLFRNSFPDYLLGINWPSLVDLAVVLLLRPPKIFWFWSIDQSHLFSVCTVHNSLLRFSAWLTDSFCWWWLQLMSDDDDVVYFQWSGLESAVNEVLSYHATCSLLWWCRGKPVVMHAECRWNKQCAVAVWLPFVVSQRSLMD